ncbi:MAG TPA: hypothetical protein VHA33_28205 [Candidatus Angelobacter sp.]|jgi:hypothetical protein|nr:hypothetical protein [Candidatus Angelobacter sp.]
MGWIQNRLRTRSVNASQSPADNPEIRFAEAARQRWQQLGDELKADLAEFGSHQKGTTFANPNENEFRISNSYSGLEIAISADFDAHIVRYEYSALNKKTAGTPEGGMLSMRQSRRGMVEFYSADERLTPEEARQVLLEPVLFPTKMAVSHS